MKKIILVFALFIISEFNLFAQKFHFGLGVTPSMAWLHPGSDDIEGDGSKFVFGYGLITEFAIAENYAFATGLTIDGKGGKLRTKNEAPFTIPPDTTEIIDFVFYDFNLRYIDIPLTLKMKTNQIGSIRYYGQFGLSPGFLISAKGTIKGGQSLIKDDEDVKEDINNINVSLVIGLGLEYNLSGNTNLLVGLIYKNGFSDVVDSSSKANVNTLGLNIGVLF